MKKAILLSFALSVLLCACLDPSRTRARRTAGELPRGPKREAVKASDYRVPPLPSTAGIDRFAARKGHGRKRAVRMHGVARETSLAVSRGLAWLKRTQAEDGSWVSKNPAATTSLALLALLGNGEDESSAFGDTVRKATAYLRRADVSADPYAHALRVYALSEWAALTGNAEILPELKTSVSVILRSQHAGGGWGAAYGVSGRRSTFVTGLQMLALLAAEDAGVRDLPLRGAMGRGLQDLVSVHNAGNGSFGEQDGRRASSGMTGLSVLCFQLAGLPRAEPCVHGLAYLDSVLHRWGGSKRPLFEAWVTVQAAFLHGGPLWRQARNTLYRQILTHQTPDGNWPPLGGEMEEGTAYATALSVLMLQAPYRLPRPDAYGLPLAWTISGDVGSATVLGILPVREADAYALGASTARAAREADKILVETDADKLRARLVRLAASSVGSDLRASVSAPVYDRTMTACDALGVPGDIAGQYPPWALAFMLYGVRLDQAGLAREDVLVRAIRRLEPAKPVEAVFIADAYAKDLANWPGPVQEALLSLALDEASAVGSLQTARKAWLASNPGALTPLKADLFAALPGYDRVFAQQNRLVADRIAAELAAGNHVIVALNALRLIGEDGVLKSLEKKAYTVRVAGEDQGS